MTDLHLLIRGDCGQAACEMCARIRSPETPSAGARRDSHRNRSDYRHAPFKGEAAK